MEKLRSLFISQYDNEIEDNKGFFLDWPLSNYPIFITFILLAVTATTLAIGAEKRAEELAIYAYYFLVIGVLIRFFELALPEATLQKLSRARKHFSMFEMKMRTSAFIKKHPPEKTVEHIQKMGGILRQFYQRLRHLRIAKPGKNLEVISEISRNIGIFLSAFFIISLIYGWMIDWRFVERYLSSLILFILGFLTLHIFTKVRS